MNDEPINKKLHDHLLAFMPRCRDHLEIAAQDLDEAVSAISTGDTESAAHLSARADAIRNFLAWERGELIAAIGDSTDKKAKKGEALPGQMALFTPKTGQGQKLLTLRNSRRDDPAE